MPTRSTRPTTSDQSQQIEITRAISGPTQISVMLYILSWITIAFNYHIIKGLWWSGTFWCIASIGLWLISLSRQKTPCRAYKFHALVGMSFLLSAMPTADAFGHIILAKHYTNGGLFILIGYIFQIIMLVGYSRLIITRLQNVKDLNRISGRLDTQLKIWDLTAPLHFSPRDKESDSQSIWRQSRFVPLAGIVLILVFRSLGFDLFESQLGIPAIMYTISSAIIVFVAGSAFGIAFHILECEHELGGKILLGRKRP